MKPFGTAYEAFREAVEKHAAGACICLTPMPGRDYHPEGCEWTYSEVAQKVEVVRRGYAGAGYGPGHRIGLLLDSRPEIVWHWLALNSLGASIVPLNPDYRAPELQYVLTHAEVDAVVVLPPRLAELERAFAAMERPPTSVILSEFPQQLAPPQRPAPNQGVALGRDTETALLYTSGTTAAPKACIITNDYCIAAGERYLSAGGMLEIRYGQDRLFNPLPLFYVNSLIITNMTMILSAGCMIYPDRFHPSTWWRDVAWSRATIIQYLGMVLPALLNQPPCADERTHQVRFGVGAGVDPTRHAEFEERFGFPIFEVWGMTEVAIASIASREPRHIDTRSIGQPLPGIQFRIVDDEGRDLPADQPGELLVRAEGEPRNRGLFGGYYKAAEITEESWHGDWFHTGDLVLKREDGSYCFVDRAKDIIRRSGQNISASEIEAVVRAHPDVKMAAAVPVTDSLREEEVMACVVLRDGVARSTETATTLVHWCLARLAYFKVPGWVCFRDTLPVTYTQKIRKRDIFSPGEDPREDPASVDCRALKKAPARHPQYPALSTAREAGI
jgi:acyl-CoA synthetase (AMP-forming)/AMP-acid ligase II